MTRPFYQRCVRFDSTRAGGWVAPWDRQWQKNTRPGERPLSHSPADGGQLPFESNIGAFGEDSAAGKPGGTE